tara:strand:- start:304 stop:486 length:183 start_codon:yes stop_codon:yes gene_type:complete
MPKAVKIKGGWKVINKYTGKQLHKFTGNDAKRKAESAVRKGYYVGRTQVRHQVSLSHRGR